MVSIASEHGGEFDKMFEEIRKQNADDVAVLHYDTFRLVPDSITLSVCTTVAARLADFDAGPADNLCECDTVGIDKIGDRKTAVFLTGFYTFEKQKALVPIFCMQAFHVLKKHAAYECDGCRLPEHVTMLLDDLPNIGYIPELDRILSTCRKYGLNAVMTAHSIEQMRFLYKEKAEVIMITCEAIVFMDRLFLPYNDFSLEYIRGRLGRTLPLINQEKRPKKKDLSLAPKQILLKKLCEIQDDSCLVLVNGMPATLDEKIIPNT